MIAIVNLITVITALELSIQPRLVFVLKRVVQVIQMKWLDPCDVVRLLYYPYSIVIVILHSFRVLSAAWHLNGSSIYKSSSDSISFVGGNDLGTIKTCLRVCVMHTIGTNEMIGLGSCIMYYNQWVVDNDYKKAH